MVGVHLIALLYIEIEKRARIRKIFLEQRLLI